VALGRRAPWPTAVLALVFAAFPQLLIYPSIVWKDVLFAGSATAGFASLAHAAAAWARPARRISLLAASAVAQPRGPGPPERRRCPAHRRGGRRLERRAGRRVRQDASRPDPWPRVPWRRRGHRDRCHRRADHSAARPDPFPAGVGRPADLRYRQRPLPRAEDRPSGAAIQGALARGPAQDRGRRRLFIGPRRSAGAGVGQGRDAGGQRRPHRLPVGRPDRATPAAHCGPGPGPSNGCS